MFRSILAVTLAATVAQAQVGSTMQKADRTWEHVRAEKTQRVVVDPQYVELRRGTEEAFLVTAKIKPTDTGEPSGYWGAPAPRNGRLAATELEIEASNGFTAHSIRYGGLRKKAFGPDAPDLVLGPNIAELHFKLRADRSLAVGDHLLKGKLRFQGISKAGVLAPEELQFDIPVHVVEHEAKVGKNEFYPHELTTAEWVGRILLMPILIPILLVTGGGC
jgi:hypothetical protein